MFRKKQELVIDDPPEENTPYFETIKRKNFFQREEVIFGVPITRGKIGLAMLVAGISFYWVMMVCVIGS